MTVVIASYENNAESPRAPSYFSQFFEDQLRQNEDGAVGVRTLYIDRDPVTFQDISRHLQGVSIRPSVAEALLDDRQVTIFNHEMADILLDCLQTPNFTAVSFVN